MMRARKRLGQHFLKDSRVIAQIIEAIAPHTEDAIVEIGPGLGALTYALASQVKRLIAIELDERFIQRLEAPSNRHFDSLSVLHANALKVDFTQFKAYAPLRIVGNLPYNITTVLLFHLFEYQRLIRDMTFMIQREIAERITAHPGNKTYGRLSVMTQFYCKAEVLFGVPPSAFKPPPKVHSSVIRLTPHASTAELPCDPIRLNQIVTTAFSHRRKTLRNALKTLIDQTTWTHLNIDPQRRPEQLTLQEFIALACYPLPDSKGM